MGSEHCIDSTDLVSPFLRMRALDQLDKLLSLFLNLSIPHIS